MPPKVEEYLQKATECEEKAWAALEDDVRSSFHRLAKHWRTLAEIAANRSDTTNRPARK